MSEQVSGNVTGAGELVEVTLTDAEWRAFQAIPKQGYSHRAWIDARIRERTEAAVAAAREGAAAAVEALPGPNNVGVARWNEGAQQGYLLAIEEAAARVRAQVPTPGFDS